MLFTHLLMVAQEEFDQKLLVIVRQSWRGTGQVGGQDLTGFIHVGDSLQENENGLLSFFRGS